MAEARHGRWTDGERRACVEEQAQSGLTVREYADAIDVAYPTFLRWKARYGGGRASAPRLVAVEVADAARSALSAAVAAADVAGAGSAHGATGRDFELTVGRVLVRVPADFDASALTRLVRVLAAC